MIRVGDTMEKREVTFSDIFEIAIKWWWMIVIGAVVLGTAVFYYNNFCVTPLYSSTTKMFVQTKGEDKSSSVLESQRSFSFGQMVVSDYMDIFRTYTFSDELAFYLSGQTRESDSAEKCLKLEATGLEKLSQKYTGNDLYSMISYSAKDQSALFSIRVVGENSQDCQIIADCLEVIMPDYLDKVTSGIALLSVVDHARSSSLPINDKTVVNTLIAVIMGAALAFAISFIIEINDTRVKDEKHLAEVFCIPIIGTIPDCAAAGTSEYRSSKYSDNNQKQG